MITADEPGGAAGDIETITKVVTGRTETHLWNDNSWRNRVRLGIRHLDGVIPGELPVVPDRTQTILDGNLSSSSGIAGTAAQPRGG